MVAASTVRPGWRCIRFQSPIRGFFGSVVEEADDVLGVAWDVEPALADARALGEAVERAALRELPQHTVCAAAAKLGPTAIRLDDRVTFSATQRATNPELTTFDWDEFTELTWTPMQSPSGDRWVPLDLARTRRSTADPRRPKPMTSIGTASGATWDTAISRALLELVERHAVAAAVYRGEPARALDPRRSGAGEVLSRLEDAAELRVGIVPSEPFGVHVAVAAVQGRRAGLPQAAFGSSARLRLEDAVRAAALEAIHVFHLSWRLLRRGVSLNATPTTINQRALWWAHHGEAHVRAFLGENRQPGSTTEHRLESRSAAEHLGTALTQTGYDWTYSDISPSWAPGTFVARAVVPSLLHLHINQFWFDVAPRFQYEVDALLRTATPFSEVYHPFV